VAINYTHLIKGTVYLKTESFIDNAYLLACQDNGMVIAKIDEKDNTRFWFWRRFGLKHDVRVTLYALFFESNNIQKINKKVVEKVLDKAHEQKMSDSSKNIYSQSNITVITLANNVILTVAEQDDPFKNFPKAAITNDTAIVIHTQQSQVNRKRKFPETNRMVSIGYNNEKNEWKRNQFEFNNTWIKKQQQIAHDYIRLPYLDEIKDIYITHINNEPIVLLITQTNHQGHCADGVYAISLTGQEKSPLSEPFWHVNIKYEKKPYSDGSIDESWRPLEKIVASTFDYTDKKLFLITENLAAEKEQQLITITVEKTINDLKERIVKKST
jgi:hypothetical protein